MRKRYSRQYFCLSACLILAICLLTGCGHIKNKWELENYVRAKHYGKFKTISFEQNEEQSSIECRDVRDGFIYHATSSFGDFAMDGTTFFSYESTSDDFTDSYLSFLYSKTGEERKRIEDEYGVNIRKAGHVMPDDAILIVAAWDERDIMDACADLGKAYEKADERKYLSRQSMYITGQGSEKETVCHTYIGGETFSKEDLDIKFYERKAKTYDGSAVFDHKENTTFGKAAAEAGITADDVMLVLGTDPPQQDNDSVELYYFTTEDGKTFWIADFMLHENYMHEYACSNYDSH